MFLKLDVHVQVHIPGTTDICGYDREGNRIELTQWNTVFVSG